MVACVEEDSVRLARSHCVRKTSDSALVAGHVLATVLAP